MIQSKEDLKFYLKCDEVAKELHIKKYKKYIFNLEWKFHKRLRKSEYYLNCYSNIYGKILYVLNKIMLNKYSLKLGWSIPPNTFGPGLSIAHPGSVVVNDEVRVGKNCRMQICVNIGASGGSRKAPVLGDNVYIGPGAKIFGEITIGSQVSIGANAVVNKSFEDDHITIAGVPAKKISNRGSENMIYDSVDHVTRM